MSSAFLRSLDLLPLLLIQVLVLFVSATASLSNATTSLSILEHVASPPLVANCTQTSLTCKISSPSPRVVVYWTFRGENASKLSDVELQSNPATNEWQLLLLCPTLEHAGTYACIAHPFNDTEVLYRKEAVIQVYVPVSVEVVPSSGVVRQQLANNAVLKCKVSAYPKTSITWEKLVDAKSGQFARVESDGRVSTDYRAPSETVQESSLVIESVKTADNGTYLCRARNEYNNESEAIIHLLVLEPPLVRLDRIETLNPRTAVLYWTVEYEGNSPLKRLSLQVKNYSLPDSDWLQVDEKIAPNITGSYVVRYLAPAVTYGFQLAAINEVGQSEWFVMNTTMPPDVPAKISEIHVLAKTNETLLIGWKRPVHDNGALISQYQMELRDSRDGLVSDQAMEVDPASGQTRNNYMYIFVNLDPGSHYIFQVRACSAIGCGNWSEPRLEADTSDGHADAPQNVRLRCIVDLNQNLNYVTVSWDLPSNARGTVVGYNVTMEGHSKYRNEANKTVLDHFREAFEIKGNQSLEFRGTIKANTNYTVRVCAINKAGCGSLSHITTGTMCTSPPTFPPSFPSELSLTLLTPNDKTCRKLRVQVHRISERNGVIKCYKVVIIKLPANADLDWLPPNASDLNVTTYSQVHSGRAKEQVAVIGAYVAEEHSSESLVRDLVIGDESYSRCNLEEEENRSPRRIKGTLLPAQGDVDGQGQGQGQAEPEDDFSTPVPRIAPALLPDGASFASLPPTPAPAPAYPYPGGGGGGGGGSRLIFDGPLAPSTNYSGFIEVRVLGPNGTLLSKQSGYFAPVLTGSLPSASSPLSPLSPLFSSMSDSATAILFGIICGLTLVLLLLLFVLCFLKRKANESLEQGDEDRLGLTALLRRRVTGHKNGHIPNSSGPISINSIHKWIAQPIPIQNLPLLFQERHANSDLLFQAEFEALPDQFNDRTTLASDLPENMAKNRYPDIKSYDQTRVRLSQINGISGSDYINADFVEGYKGRKVFICAQGPTDRTMADFIRMIYEQKVSVVVMLTGIEEHGKIKCAQYWNEDQGVAKDIEGLYTVTLQSMKRYSDFVVRRFRLQTVGGRANGKVEGMAEEGGGGGGGGQEKSSPAKGALGDIDGGRDILQFHFLMWKDFLAPEQPSWLLRFIKRVNEHYCPDKGPLLVHCSAGVGRTGTFIAIDSLIPEITNGTYLNIWECVSHLRYQRNYLVQSLKQYTFVYRALMEFAQFGDTEVEICHLRDHYRQLKEQKFEGNVSGVVAEFDRLNEVIEDPKSCCVGTMDMNMNKNRYDFIIPYDINRVILPPSPAKEQSSYINASFVQGYDRSLSFIVTQDPLETSYVEFWKMIAEQTCVTLVMLSEVGEGQSKCQAYWPKAEASYDYVQVKFESEEFNQIYVTRKFSVTNTKTKDSHILTQYQFLVWKSSVVPESSLPLLSLIAVASSNNSSSGSPVVVHCSGGGDRSSVFVTLSALIEQITSEERVDVFQTARYTRSQRICALQTQAQYDFLYRSLIDYIESHNLCDITDTQL